MIRITRDDVLEYVNYMNDDNPVHREERAIIPGNLLVHTIMKHLELTRVEKSSTHFKHPVYVGEKLNFDYHQTGDVIEYKVAVNNLLKLSGTLEVQGDNL